MYKSPIDIKFDEWKLELSEMFDNNCIKAVQSYGFKIDKAELEKALAYDRKQYEKGLRDAKPIHIRIKNERLNVDTDAYYDPLRKIIYTNCISEEYAALNGYVWEEIKDQFSEV